MRQRIRHIKECNRVLTAAVALFITVLSCGRASGERKYGEAESKIDTATYVLPLPDVPRTITNPEQRAAFIVDRYWDNMDWTNAELLNSERFMGESMATYGALLSIAPEKDASKAVNALVNRLGTENPKALNEVAEYAYTYFYYPDAPQYNGELYLMFVNPLLAQKSVSDQDRLRLQHRKDEIMKNRVGKIAADFEYIDVYGKKRELLKTARDADYRLVMFYDPDCEVCDEAIKIINESEIFGEAQKKGEIAVIAINAYGQESGGKAQVKKGMPSQWTVGYSPGGEIEEDEIYAIRATPAIYILDREGRVMEKDLSLMRLKEIVNQLKTPEVISGSTP